MLKPRAIGTVALSSILAGIAILPRTLGFLLYGGAPIRAHLFNEPNASYPDPGAGFYSHSGASYSGVTPWRGRVAGRACLDGPALAGCSLGECE